MTFTLCGFLIIRELSATVNHVIKKPYYLYSPDPVMFNIY